MKKLSTILVFCACIIAAFAFSSTGNEVHASALSTPRITNVQQSDIEECAVKVEWTSNNKRYS